eukprot:247099-Rhodomonas_salina.3
MDVLLGTDVSSWYSLLDSDEPLCQLGTDKLIWYSLLGTDERARYVWWYQDPDDPIYFVVSGK